MVVGALLLSLVAAGHPLYVSRAEGKLLAAEMSDPTVERFGAGVFYSASNIRFRERAPGGGNLIERIDAIMRNVAEEVPNLDPPTRFVLGPTALVTERGGRGAPSGTVRGALFFGTDAVTHVDVVSGPEDGAILPDLVAEPLGVGLGDMVELHDEDSDRAVTIRVGGVYRSLYSQPRSGYWSPWSEDIYSQCFDCPAPPQFILVDRAELDRLARDLGHADADYGWVAPVRDGPLTIDQARGIDATSTRIIREAARRGTALGRVLRCCGRMYGGSFFFGRRDIEFRSSMPLVLRETERRTATAEGPLRLLLIAGLGVAASVMAAAAAFAVAGRRTEAALLHARGWGPIRFAAKSTLEGVLPTVIGVAAGLGLGWWSISTFGPAAPPAPSARVISLSWAVAAGAAGLLVLGVVSGVSFIRTFEVHASKRRLAWVPWEVFAIAGALLVLSRLNAGGALIEDTRLDIRRPSALLLAFPVLFVAGFATLGARLLVEGMRRIGTRGSDRSPVTYLMLHRLTGLPRLTVLLVSAAALCLGIFIDSQTMVRSLRATVNAKAGVFVGSDVQVQIDSNAPGQERFPLPITRVQRVKYAGELTPGEVPFDMVGIDPGSFVGAAFWDDAFSDEPLEDLVSRLRRADGPLPALLIQSDGNPTRMAIAQIDTPIEVVGRAEAFPGVSSNDPVLVVDGRSLEQRLGAGGNPLTRPGARTELWIAGETDRALAAVPELEAFALGTLTADEVKDVPFIAAAIDTFAMLNVLGLAAAVLVIGILVVYLQARQRARAVSNVLSMRMGMRRAQARAALVLELGAMLLAASVLGASTGMVAGRLITPLLDPLETIPPAPLFDAPVAVVAWTVVGLVVVAVVGGWVVHRRADRVDLGEVLRVAE